VAPAKDPAGEAAEKAVERVFFLLGVDVHDAASIEEFRQDLRFGKSMRKYAEQGTAAMVKVVAMLVVSGFIWAIQNKLNPFAGK
jgi:hypothetical protein